MTRRFRAMGCTVEIGGATPGEARAIELMFHDRDQRFSRFREDSELARVNGAAYRVLQVSPDFAAMLALALDAAVHTGGAVDPTLGEAIEAAGYDRDFASLEPRPEPARPGAGGRWHAIRVRGQILSRPPGLQLDLNGVVKGRTVDDGLALIEGDGFVSAGGDYAGRGSRAVSLPGGQAVQVTSGALATSGRSRRRWLRAGVWQDHLIDPRTGSPAISPWVEVTVAAATCLQADVAAKAAYLLGAEGPRWLDDRGMAGRFLGPRDLIVLNDIWRRSLGEQAAA
jgi:thiamine biosynthesis lipoprotein